MDRLIAPNSVDAAHADTAPVTGTPAYATDGNPATGVPATLWPSYQYNAIQEELIAFLTAADVAPDRMDNAQILAACRALFAAVAGSATQTFSVAAATALTHAPEVGQVQRSAFNYAGLAGGTANALTATLNIAPGSYTDYLVVTVRVASTNTGSVSLNVNGLGVVPVIGLGHQPLQGSELVAGGFATFAYSANFSEAILLEATGGPVQVAPATASQHAVQLQQVGNRAGEICFFALSSPPTGFLAADGSAVSRTTYASLFAAIGTTFGAGNGSTTFNVPDMRGRFPRAWDNGAGVDPGRTLGSVQADSFASHNHGVTDPQHTHGFTVSNGSGSTNNVLVGQLNQAPGTNTTGPASTGISIQNTGGTETRPKNVALLACIKY